MNSDATRTPPRSAALLRGTTLRLALTAALFATTANALAGDAAKAADAPGGHLTAATRLRDWFQTGQASWYGMQFQGHKTSSGERFNMNAFTCAHRSLPLGSWLRVTNLRNHKTVLVKVNDRGPMVESRIVDLSFAAAQFLGMRGTGKVALERVAPNDPEIAKTLVAQLPPPELPQLVPSR